MCHVSPTASLFSAVIASCSSFLLVYHAWRYNRLRCLVTFKRDDAFRWLVTWCLALSCFSLMISQVIQTYVKYNEYYVYIPKLGVRVKPYQLWTATNVRLFRDSNWLLVAGVVCLLAVHLEEILFWGYLIQTIKSQRTQPWFKSIYFKLWCAGVITCTGILFGVAGIDTVALTSMEVNIFFAGALLSLIMTCGSIVILRMFPAFIDESARQGANPEVIAKLQFFKSMHNLRACFRGIYSVTLVILGADGLSSKQKINHQEFLTDILFAASVFCIFSSTMLSLLILLPRSMQEEAGYRKTAGHVYVRHTSVPAPDTPASASGSGSGSNPPSYHTPTSSTAWAGAAAAAELTGPWAILGERLNLEKEEVRELIANNAEMYAERERGYEMPFARGTDY